MSVYFTDVYPFSGDDKRATEIRWSNMARSFVSDGVIDRYLIPELALTGNLQVYADASGMLVKIRNGMYALRGGFGTLATEQTQAIDPADPVNPRIDLVIVRRNFSDAGRMMVTVLKGTAAASPTAPTVTQGSTVWEQGLAEVYVAANATSIGASNVTDRRVYSIGTPLATNEFRLSLTTGVPITASNVTAATNLFWMPRFGKRGAITLVDGSLARLFQFSEIGKSLSGLAANTLYDAFVDPKGALYFYAWASTTARNATYDIESLAGVPFKHLKGDASKRYLGTFSLTGTAGQCEDSLTKRYLWNMDNRAMRRMYLREGSVWTGTYASFTAVGSGVSLVNGIGEEADGWFKYQGSLSGINNAAGLMDRNGNVFSAGGGSNFDTYEGVWPSSPIPLNIGLETIKKCLKCVSSASLTEDLVAGNGLIGYVMA